MNTNTFRNSKRLQVLYLSNNRLTEIPSDLFRTLQNLRFIDMSHNLLRTLPEVLFTDEDLEQLDVSHNQLTKVPASSFTNIAALSLNILDLSNNNIGSINSMDFSKFRVFTQYF